jgi:DNA (cytosine-5)-methyltransferase 1
MIDGKPVLYDLGCCAGGLARGYQQAGWHVIGFDIEPQPRYAGDEFRQADALTLDLSGADAIHASMPCQKWATASRHNGIVYPDLITPLRPRLIRSGKPWVMENVPAAPLRADITLCGCYFGLEIPGLGYLNRERVFETSWRSTAGFGLPPHRHRGYAISIAGHGTPSWQRRLTGHIGVEYWRQIMGIDWMRREELTESCPPAYGWFMGGLLMDQLASADARNRACCNTAA